MSAITLQLRRAAADLAQLDVFLLAPNRQQAFSVPLEPQLLARYQAWQRRFLLHYETHEPPSEVVSSYGRQLCEAMACWLAEPAWLPLRQTLAALPEVPLLISCQDPQLEALPWESLGADGLGVGRAIWRQPPSAGHSLGSGQQRPPRPRQPRVLLVLGDERSLDVSLELTPLQALQRRHCIALTVLQGEACSLVALHQALLAPQGWDALVFLGHSDRDPAAGGRLQLGNGQWVTAAAFLEELRQAAQLGLPLVLLNSCNGVDLAHSVLGAGIPWCVCFREPLPSRAAGVAFARLVEALQGGQPLSAGLQQFRQSRGQQIELVGTDLLLSVYSSGVPIDLRLPLRRRALLARRLRQTTTAQLVATGVCLALADTAALVPWNPLSTYLLDRRLAVQRIWRQLTDQHGPSAVPIGVVLLDPAQSTATATPGASAGMVSRQALADVLRVAPPRITRVGLDVVLDREAPGTAALAAVLREQQRPLVVSGWFGARAAADDAGRKTAQLTPQLQNLGLLVRKLDVNTPGRSDPQALQPVPLRVQEPLNAEHFAAALAAHPAPLLPAETVIDWSLDWSRLIQRLEPAQLPASAVQTVLIGTSAGQLQNNPDLFAAPGAAGTAMASLSGGSDRAVPGVLVQAVLVQSIEQKHWLSLFPLPVAVALSSGFGVLLEAAVEQRRRRLLIVVLIAAVALPVTLQLAVSLRVLVPLLLPLTALLWTAAVRRD